MKACMRLLVCGWLVIAAAGPVHAQMPARDLTIELRQVEEGRDDGTHFAAGASALDLSWEPQTVRVRNGERALLRLREDIPMQWVQSVSVGSAASASAGSASTSVSTALAWFDAGQAMVVQPRWKGGNQPALLAIEAQQSSVQERTGADLPPQSRRSVATVVTAPLGQWVTIAVTGKLAPSGSYSSGSGQLARRLLQIRVLVP